MPWQTHDYPEDNRSAAHNLVRAAVPKFICETRRLGRLLCGNFGCSNRSWRDALRYSDFGDKIQRWLCRECGLRFSDPNDVKKRAGLSLKYERLFLGWGLVSNELRPSLGGES